MSNYVVSKELHSLYKFKREFYANSDESSKHMKRGSYLACYFTSAQSLPRVKTQRTQCPAIGAIIPTS